MAAFGAQGIVIRRSSTVAASTVSITGNDIGCTQTATGFTRQAGFAGWDIGMRIESNASNNNGVWTVKGGTGVGSTTLTVHEPIVAQASGATMTLTGRAMQAIGQIVSFNGPSMSANVIDITNLGSTAKEKMVGVYDGGQLAISVILEMESSGAILHNELLADFQAGTLRRYDIKFTDTGTSQPSFIYFGGYLTGYNITGSVDNALKADLTIAISSGAVLVDKV